MKNTFTILLFLITCPIFAQAPLGYYDSARELTGDSLRAELYRLVSNHFEYPYTSSATDVWDILKETDRDPDNPDNVILLYTGMSVDAAQEWNSGAGWAREHVWAKIHGDFGTDKGAGTDVHHLRPVHQPTNSARNSRWFDECDIPYGTYGNFKCEDSWAWEPRDAVKGDIARMIFYMDLRYEGQNGEPDLQIVDSIPSVNHTTEPIHAKLSTLMQWHLNDPVDAWELNRNDIIYSDYQGNRNPFIDKPGFACMLWPEACDLVPVAEETIRDAQLAIFPNPNNGKFSIQLEMAAFNEVVVGVYDPIGRLLKEDAFAGNGLVTQPVDITDLAPGIYFVRVKVAEEMRIGRVVKR